MSRALLAVLIVAAIAAPSAKADTLYQFTVTGDSHTLQFSLPNPGTVTETPHAIEVYLSTTGTVDGVGGYTFNTGFVAEANGYQGPNFTIDVAPLPPNTPTPSSMQLADFDLYGKDLLQLVADQPNPQPCFLGCPNDLLTFAFLPSDYSFYGFGPEGVPGDYTVDIVQQTFSATTPEPMPWLLLLTGTAFLIPLTCRPASRHTTHSCSS